MGKRPSRETVIEPTAPRTSTVPTAGTGRNRPRPEPARAEVEDAGMIVLELRQNRPASVCFDRADHLLLCATR